MVSLMTVGEKFGMAVDNVVVANARDVIMDGAVIYICGLMFQAFKTAVGKIRLRADISKAILFLEERGIELARLPPALKARATSALSCGVAI